MTSLLHCICSVICRFSDSFLTYRGGQLGLAAASDLAVNFGSLFLSPQQPPLPLQVTRAEPCQGRMVVGGFARTHIGPEAKGKGKAHTGHLPPCSGFLIDSRWRDRGINEVGVLAKCFPSSSHH